MIPARNADRYSLALQRGWRVCALLAAVGAVLFPAMSQVRRQATTSGRLSIAYDAPSVNLVKFPKDLFATTGSFQNDIAGLTSNEATSAAQRAAAGSLDIGVSPDGTTHTALLSVTGATESATDQGFDALVSALRASRKKSLTATLAEFDRAVSQMKPVAEKRVTEIDKQISALSPSDTLLAQALQAERSTRADDLLQLDSQRAVLDGYANDPISQVTVLDRSRPSTRSRLTLGNLVIGAVLGLLLAVVGIVLRTFGRRRIHTRSDVARLLGPVPVVALPNVTRNGSDQAFLQRAVLAGGPGARDRLTILTDPAVPAISERLLSAWSSLRGTLDAAPDVTIEPWSFPSVTSAGSSGGPLGDVLLVLAWGTSRETSVVSIAAAADALGATVRTVAIAQVPPRYLEQAGL